MRHITFDAMGTLVEAWVEADGTGVVEWFEEVEEVCSRFRPTSELSSINARAPGATSVSPMMAEVLDCASHLRELTSGLVDIGVGGVLTSWGYDRTFPEVISLTDSPAEGHQVSWTFGDGAVRLGSGTTLDLGGVAKGWACDQAVARGLAVVVSAGGDMRSNDTATVASIIDPWGDVVAKVHIGRRGLATSSIARRRWEVGSREVSHIIDPSTMEPVETPILSATAVARSAVEAEAAAKAILLQGVDGLVWADECPWVHGSVVIWNDGSVYGTHDVELVA